MKTLKVICFTAMVLFTFSACNNDEPEKEPEVTISNGTYTGLLTVDQIDGTFYKQDNTSVIVEINENNTLNFTMLKVKFSDRMPITLDMNVAGVITKTGDNLLILSGDSIIPTAMGGEFANYTMTGIEGTLSEENLEMSMLCGVYPLTFSGVIKK